MSTETLPQTAGSDSPPRGRRLLKTALGVAAVVLAVFALWSSTVFVDESEYVVVERLGDIVAVYDRDEDRGLKFKLPWPIDTTRRFDRRVRLFSPQGRERPTLDKKNITVAAYVCWRIAEPRKNNSADVSSRPVVRFYQVLGDPQVAESKIDDLLRDVLNSELSRIEFSDLFAAAGSHSGPSGVDGGKLAEIAARVKTRLERGADGRKPLGDDFGIEIVDLRIRPLESPARQPPIGLRADAQREEAGIRSHSQ